MDSGYCLSELPKNISFGVEFATSLITGTKKKIHEE
jgi:hypothetical protein